MTLPAPTPLRRARGFTLLELILVLIVISIAGVLVLPSISGSRGRSRLDADVSGLLGLARKARALAAGEGRTYYLRIDPLERRAQLVRQRDPLSPASEGDDPERDVTADAPWSTPLALAEGVELIEAWLGAGEAEERAADGELVEVAFYPHGAASPCRLVFGTGDDRLTLRVAGPAGLARIDDEVGS